MNRACSRSAAGMSGFDPAFAGYEERREMIGRTMPRLYRYPVLALVLGLLLLTGCAATGGSANKTHDLTDIMPGG